MLSGTNHQPENPRPSAGRWPVGLACLVFLLAVLPLAAAPASAQSDTAFGDGKLFHLERGTYGELFPNGGHGLPPGRQVLAFDVHEGSTVTRTLVPGTDSGGAEANQILIADPGSDRLFALWTASSGGVVQGIHLASWAPGGAPQDGWGETIELAGHSSGDGSEMLAPLVTVTRDADPEVDRTVVHIVWQEVDVEGTESTWYSPIVVNGGSYLGWNPVVRLDDRTAIDPDGEAQSGELWRRPALEPGTDGHSVVVAVPRRTDGRILVLRLRLLPTALQDLADSVRGTIVLVGANTQVEGSILSLAEEVRGTIVLVGARFHSGVRSYIASESYDEILAYGPDFSSENLDDIAGRVWDRIIDSGASILDGEMEPEGHACSIVHLGEDGPSAEAPLHQLDICVISDRPAPPFEGRPSMLLSEDGASVLLAWGGDEGEVHFTTTEDDGWKDPVVAPWPDTEFEEALVLLRGAVRP